jgi:hypothetical protein
LVDFDEKFHPIKYLMRQLTLELAWCPKRRREDDMDRANKKMRQEQYEKLGDDVIGHILSFCDGNDIRQAKCVCRDWYRKIHYNRACRNVATEHLVTNIAFRLQTRGFNVNTLAQLYKKRDIMLETMHKFQTQTLCHWANAILDEYKQYFTSPVEVTSYKYDRNLSESEYDVGYVAQSYGYPIRVTIQTGAWKLALVYYSTWKKTLDIAVELLDGERSGKHEEEEEEEEEGGGYYYHIWASDEYSLQQFTTLTPGRWLELVLRLLFFDKWKEIMAAEKIREAMLAVKNPRRDYASFLKLLSDSAYECGIHDLMPHYVGQYY